MTAVNGRAHERDTLLDVDVATSDRRPQAWADAADQTCSL